MPAILTAFWNGHKNSKENKKLENLRIVFTCDQVTRKNNKLVIRQFFWKSVLRNELSCVKIHGFQAKWSILWPHSWHNFFKWSHIVHKGAYWNDKQCWLQKFSFSLDEKFIFHFLSARKQIFLWRAYHIFVAKLYQINFLKY